MKTVAFIAAVKFFHEHAGGVVGRRMVNAWNLAKAETRAKAIGMSVVWEDDREAWDGEGPAPAILAYAYVSDLEPHRYSSLAGLGMIDLDSWRDPYVRVVEAELCAEALGVLDAAREADACAEAVELAARATYAGPTA
jgi:hypothetical protein